MRVHLINPSGVSFGTAVITPRWLYVLAAATPANFGDPCLVDETLEPVNPLDINAGDIVGIGRQGQLRSSHGAQTKSPDVGETPGDERSSVQSQLPAGCGGFLR